MSQTPHLPIKTPLNSWEHFQPFRQLLQLLESLGIADNIQSWCSRSQVFKSDMCFIFSVGGSSQYTVQSNFELWFITTYNRRDYLFLANFWDILEAAGYESTSCRDAIKRMGFNYVFTDARAKKLGNAGGRSRADNMDLSDFAPPPTPAVSRPKRDPVLTFFREEPGWVDDSTADRSVLAEIVKSVDHPLVKALSAEINRDSLVDYLLTYPQALPIVALALIDMGLCVAYTGGVQLRSSTNILQIRIGDEELIQRAISPFIEQIPLIRLARFTAADSSSDARFFPSLFNGLTEGMLRELLVKYRKRASEVGRWSFPDLIAEIADWENGLKRFAPGQVELFKLEVLTLLRTAGAPNLLPWLDCTDLRRALRRIQSSPDDDKVIAIPPPQPLQTLTPQQGAWYGLFINAGLSPTDANRYQDSFDSQGIEVAQMADLDRDALKDLGVLMGHQLKLLRYFATLLH
jgi:hypothetical protein